jgi:hypothetical protein
VEQGIDAFLRVQPRQGQQERGVVRRIEVGAPDGGRIRQRAEGMHNEGPVFGAAAGNDVAGDVMGDTDEEVGGAIVLQVVRTAEPADDRARHA